jgi:hypothetical protein
LLGSGLSNADASEYPQDEELSQMGSLLAVADETPNKR